jgi:hypothetical protein
MPLGDVLDERVDQTRLTSDGRIPVKTGVLAGPLRFGAGRHDGLPVRVAYVERKDLLVLRTGALLEGAVDAVRYRARVFGGVWKARHGQSQAKAMMVTVLTPTTV